MLLRVSHQDPSGSTHFVSNASSLPLVAAKHTVALNALVVQCHYPLFVGSATLPMNKMLPVPLSRIMKRNG